ncbi:MAG: ABC transporter substrate-binding protein, partial [Alicyclobacillus sp.]|nr:ABC transporter substrate-binding protein [Alicyclobacillus sp.]
MKKQTAFMAGLSALAMGLSVMAGPVASYADTSLPPLTMVGNDTGNFVRNFNPYASGNLMGTIGLVYEPLFYFSRVSGQTYPLLGTKYAWSNGDRVLTVTLRKNVKWSDGEKFSVDDVLYTFNFLKAHPSADGMSIWKQITNVEAVGSGQVRFIFKQPNVPYAYYILQGVVIIPQHIFSKVKGDPTKWVDPDPIGTGPYTLQKFSPQAYYFQANKNYWGGESKVPVVEFPAYTGSDSANMALANGSIQWGGEFIPNIDKTYVSKDPAHRHYWFPPDTPVLLYTNLKDPVLSQLPVRKAINLAINRPQLAKIAEYGYEQVSSPTGLVLPNFKSWLNHALPKSDTTFTYDPSQAVKTLQNAGYTKNSQGVFVSPQGKPLKFTLNVVSGWTDWDEMALMIARSLGDIGIEVNVRQLQFGTYYSDLTSGKYQLCICWTAGGPTPFYTYQGLYEPKNPNNFERWSNSTTTKLLLTLEHNSNPAVQHKAINQLEKITAEQLPSLPLVDGAVWY